MKRFKPFKRVAIALPLCLSGPLVAAQSLDQLISVGATAQETANDTLQGIKKFKPTDFNRALGNNATRKVWANWVNSKVGSALEVSKSSRLPLIATALEAAESGAETLGNLYEGNLTGAGTVAVNTAVSKITVAGGAMAGGKLFAYVGAVAGAWVPVVGPVAGGVVGGVVGSVGGAVVTSVAIGSDSVTNWVSSTFEGFFAKDDAYYSKLAKQNRENFLTERAETAARAQAERAQNAAIAKGEQAKAQAAREFGYDVRPGSSDNAEIQFSAGKLPDFEMPQPEASDPGKTTPLFASNFTVQITSWVNPEFTGTEKFIIKEGEVSAYINAPVPIAPEFYNSGRREGAFKGRIEANKITGTWADSFRYTFVPGKSNCAGPMLNTMKTQIELIMNQGGSVSGRIIGGTSQLKVSGCPNGEVNRTEQVPANTLQGEWKIIE